MIRRAKRLAVGGTHGRLLGLEAKKPRNAQRFSREPSKQGRGNLFHKSDA
jgi:hypothetical protein